MAKRNLTKKQKEVLVKRLEKARAAKKPAKLKTVHPSVRELPDDDLFSYANVKEWQKVTKERIAAAQQAHRMGTKGALADLQTLKSYNNTIQNYIKTGDWHNSYAGPYMEKKLQRKCIAMGYLPNGKPKREIGTWYPDIQDVWTAELENEERATFKMPKLTFTKDGHILVDSSTKKKVRKKRGSK